MRVMLCKSLGSLTFPHETFPGPDMVHPRSLLRSHAEWYVDLLYARTGMSEMRWLELVVCVEMAVGREIQGLLEGCSGVHGRKRV